MGEHAGFHAVPKVTPAIQRPAVRSSHTTAVHPKWRCMVWVGFYLAPCKHDRTMDFFQWHWWAGLALILMIAEIFVPGFFLLCLGIGCVGPAIADFLGAGVAGQLVASAAFRSLSRSSPFGR
jgi:hypothetical protein